MRALHLSFWLHHPYELHETAKWAEKGYYGGEAAFRETDQAEYQPLLALLERNSQRYPKMRVSLAVSGVWLEQAERWNAELIKRVRKLVEKHAVSLVVVPYYYSMAAFYDLDGLKSQVLQMQEKLKGTFGVTSQILAVPELCYHNRLAKWAEKLGFRMMLVGDATKALDWRSPNQVYEAKGCEDLRVLFENAKLTRMIETADESVQAEKVFAAKIFQKQLDLALLRGNLVDLYFRSEIFAKWRDAGLISFFDELIKKWMETPGMRLVGAEDLLEVPPVAEISVKKTASWRGESEKDYDLPAWWTEAEAKNSQNLYSLRKNIVAVRERDLYVDFARLTAYDYAQGGKEFGEILADLQKRLLKFLQDDEINEGRYKGGVMASTAVRVKFDHKAREARKRREALVQMYREANSELDGSAVWDDEMDDAEAAIQVLAQRMKQSQEGEQDNYDDAAEAEVVAEDIWMENEVEDEEMPAEDDVNMDGVDDLMDEMMDDSTDDVTDTASDDTIVAEEAPRAKKKRKKIVIE